METPIVELTVELDPTPESPHAPDVVYRPPKEGDDDFIFDSWLQSYRRAPRVRNEPGPNYYTVQRRLINTLLQNSLVVMAVDGADPSHIFGFVCFAKVDVHAGTFIRVGALIHYVYVKGGFRQFGIGRDLVKAVLESIGTTVVRHSHETSKGKKFMRHFHSTYAPYVTVSE